MTPATRVRIAAGVSLEQAARRAGVSPPYLRRLESSGGFPYPLACRLSAVLSCGIDTFLYSLTPKPKRSAGSKKKNETTAAVRGTSRITSGSVRLPRQGRDAGAAK